MLTLAEVLFISRRASGDCANEKLSPAKVEKKEFSQQQKDDKKKELTELQEVVDKQEFNELQKVTTDKQEFAEQDAEVPNVADSYELDPEEISYSGMEYKLYFQKIEYPLGLLSASPPKRFKKNFLHSSCSYFNHKPYG